LGISHSSIAAYGQVVAFGLVSSASIMVPGAWFPLTARIAAEQKEACLGVHLTLNAEWDDCRWSPLTQRDPAAGLADEAGYFHRDPRILAEWAEPETVYGEMAAQVERALAAGIDVSHVDAHMMTAANADYFPLYFRLARSFRLPAFHLRLDEAGWRGLGFETERATEAAAAVTALESDGFPLFDRFFCPPLEDHRDRVARMCEYLRDLEPGLTHIMIHPAEDSAETRAFSPDWRARVADLAAFTHAELRECVRARGIQTITYRDLRRLVREA
jgi:hypothetical protein